MTVIVEKSWKFFDSATPATEERSSLGPSVLVVGNVTEWKDAGRRLPADALMSFADFSDITSDLLELLRPDIVLSPLMSGAFDCLDLAQVLDQANYRGRYRVVAPVMPDPDIIKAEIQEFCPGIDFCFIFTSDEFGRRLS